MKIIHLSLMVTLLANLMLSACGGSDSNDNHANVPIDPKPQPFQSSFTSTISIEEKTSTGANIYTVQSQSTNEQDSVLAYSVSTQLVNTLQLENGNSRIIKYPLLEQLFLFELEKNALRLEVSYDPILKKANSFFLIKAVSKTDQLGRKFQCRQNLPTFLEPCAGVTIDYDAVTGTANINFNQSTFKSNDFPLNDVLILNGKLQGTLSIPPQTIQSIPKVSQGSVTIDGQTHQIVAAVNHPSQILGSRIMNAGIAMLLDNANLISFTRDERSLYSEYVDRSTDFFTATPIDISKLMFKDLKNVSQFILQPAVFQFERFGNEAVQQPISISAMVEAPLPQQTLVISPKPSQNPAVDKDNPWYANRSLFNRTTIPNNLGVRVINHNTVIIENEEITATIQDKKLKSIQLSGMVYGFGSIDSVVFYNYQCGDTPSACQGATVEPNGFGVRFNQTVLNHTQTENRSDEFALPPAVTLNGSLVYLGR